jgi:tRNA pseudouridine38/39 synthase
LPIKKKPRVPKPFDPSAHNYRFIALKFAYLGGGYNGFEHHNNNRTPVPTVEEELWKALVRTRLIAPPSLKDTSLDTRVTLLDDFGPGKHTPTPVDWDGTEYSKCGRTDCGVSAFGQVIGIRVRSARPLNGLTTPQPGVEQDNFNPIADELPYLAMLNRVLPPTIRMLAWCPSPPSNFSARYSCKEREYKYFFTIPAYLPIPDDRRFEQNANPWLDVEAMSEAASYLVGTNDFRNMCKIDGSKQLTNFTRRISHASVDKVSELEAPTFLSLRSNGDSDSPRGTQRYPALYAFTVRGSAFLWHQVRCMVGILFLVGQGLEPPDVVKKLLDVANCPSRPLYEMASDKPLVLWDCRFSATHGVVAEGEERVVDRGDGEDELDWLFPGSQQAGSSKVQSSQWSRMGVMETLWAEWRQAKIDEALASHLMDIVALQGSEAKTALVSEKSTKVFVGGDGALYKGDYIPLMKRKRMEVPDVLNARWAERKGTRFRPKAAEGSSDISLSISGS